MIYIQIERKLIFGDTWKSIVNQLKNISFDEITNKKEYMFNVSKRVDTLFNKYIEHYNYQGFVKALDKLMILKIFKCSDCDFFCLHPRNDIYYCSKKNIFQHTFNPNLVDCNFMTNKQIQKIRRNQK